jgi:DNA-binding transcriptional LysR family regulator
MLPTPAGRALLPVARRMLGLVDEAATQAVALVQGSTQMVRVAAVSAAVGSLLARAVPVFARANPDILVSVEEADAARHSAMLSGGDADCAVCRAPSVVPEGWVFRPLWPDRFAIVAAPDHPLVRKRRLGKHHLAAATWLVTSSAVASRRAFDALFDDAGIAPRTYNVVTSSTTMVWRLLVQDPLLALLPLSVVRHLLDARQLAEVRWQPVLGFDNLGILAPAMGRGEALERFFDFMVEHAAPNSERTPS